MASVQFSHVLLPHPPQCNSHTGPRGVQNTTRTEGQCHSNTDGCEFLAFLNSLYLVLIRLQAGHGLVVVHSPHCEYHCHS